MSDRQADMLDAAADVIERDGWYQGDYYPGADGDWYISRVPVGEIPGAGLPKCVRGALYTAQQEMNGYTGHREGEHMRLARAICNTEGSTSSLSLAWIVRWNDDPTTTKQQVLDTLRKTAKGERD